MKQCLKVNLKCTARKVQVTIMKLAIDGMGGDNAPKAIVEGVLLALEDFPNLEVQLYGKQQEMQPF